MDVPAPEPIALEDSEALMADLCALTLYPALPSQQRCTRIWPPCGS